MRNAAKRLFTCKIGFDTAEHKPFKLRKIFSLIEVLIRKHFDVRGKDEDVLPYRDAAYIWGQVSAQILRLGGVE